MRTACMGLVLALGFFSLSAQAGDRFRLGAVVYTPGFYSGAFGFRPPHVNGFYGHRYVPRAFRHYPRYYGHDHYYPRRHRAHRHDFYHGHRYHPRRDFRRSYRHFGPSGFFFPRGRVIHYVRHRHDRWCGH